MAFAVRAKAGMAGEVGVQNKLLDAMSDTAEQHIETPAEDTAWRLMA